MAKLIIFVRIKKGKVKISAPKHLHIDDYDYHLPDERIAKYPLSKRDSSKLLVCKYGNIEQASFSSIADYIPENALMVFNNTKVIQARMFFHKSTGAQIEIFCLEPHTPHDYALIFQTTGRCAWTCLVGNAKKWKEGELTNVITVNGIDVSLIARRVQVSGETNIIEFEWDNSDFTFSDLLEAGGELPIPPYLNRRTEEKDKETYQTTYSKIKGSVAAPTAGLHFTEDVMSQLKDKGVQLNEVTLHVGAGTFKPVKTETIEDHIMHTEFISVPKQMIENLLNHKGKVIAVGTTTVRTLESLYYLGCSLQKDINAELKVSQWQPYDNEDVSISVEQALTNLLTYLNNHKLSTLLADTQIIIAPGYQFRIVDGIVTNFHQPKSTLLLLVSAFLDGKWKQLYDYAMSHDFRFLSYGDSSLLLKD